MKKRRDKRGRVLRNGECQRKDGLYQFDYIDSKGKSQCAYSWKLEPTDPLPYGKRKCKSLREKEAEIQRDILDGISSGDKDLTVFELAKKYISQRTNVRESTKAGYKTVLNTLEKESFGYKRVTAVKLSDAKSWLIKLQQEDGKGFSTIHTIRGVLKPAFQLAVDDDIIRKNPFAFELMSVIENDSITRDAITEDEKKCFLEFIKNDKHFCKYYDAIYILFFTGLRISEFSGLTLKDIDFKNRCINVDHQLYRTSDMRYLIIPPKTDSGNRCIPMQTEVYNAFARIVKNRKVTSEPILKDEKGKLYSGFLYLDKNGMPMVALHWEKYFKHIRKKYRKKNKEPLPKITPHVCRHTFCSHCAAKGINPKHLQYLMGHSDISITLNLYTHIEFKNVKNEFLNLEEVAL